MTSGSFRFDRFLLDPADRRLKRDGAPVELNARYLDALALLVREQGKLVSKDRFLDEVWRGVPVTDEALTQCIKTLRRQLGDDAARPRFIETVPKHGYRFIAAVEDGAGRIPDTPPLAAPSPASHYSWRECLILTGAGTLGAGIAGLLGGIFYGVAGASQPLQAGTGAVSILLVLLALTLVAALTGGAGVSFGIAAAGFARNDRGLWSAFGGALGGALIGGFVKLLGLDAFDLLLGKSPGDITGAAEGAMLGGAAGIGCWLASRDGAFRLRRSMIAAGLVGGATGILVPLLGGRLMGGSLDLLARQFTDSRLRLDQIGAILGESGFGPLSQIVTAGLEGALFSACIVGAIILGRRAVGGTR
ncbi:transcriptional regulator [Sphingomonas sp.]|jgi:DNA-binding winged helix-turn-helix (wHTH) protein|uniref:winged helix-turn-helix domain-containing protein n=1 Tax=Sphingomonas sp. TaxID=28214 RepID=UPI002EDB52BE